MLWVKVCWYTCIYFFCDTDKKCFIGVKSLMSGKSKWVRHFNLLSNLFTLNQHCHRHYHGLFLCSPLWYYRFTAKVNIVPISLVNKNKALPTRVLGEIILRSPTTDCCWANRGVSLRSRRLEVVGTRKNGRARRRRARSLFRPLLPSACYAGYRGVLLTEKIHWNNSRHPGVYFPLFAVADLRCECEIYSYFTWATRCLKKSCIR